MNKNKQYGNRKQMIRLLLINLTTLLLSLTVTSLIMTAISFKLDLSTEIVYYLTYIVISIVATTNGFFLAREIKSKGWLVGTASNLVFALSVLIANFFVGEKEFNKYFVLKILLILTMGMVGGVLGVNKRKKFK